MNEGKKFADNYFSYSDAWTALKEFKAGIEVKVNEDGILGDTGLYYRVIDFTDGKYWYGLSRDAGMVGLITVKEVHYDIIEDERGCHVEESEERKS